MGAEIKKSSHDAFYTNIKIQVESKKTLVGYDVAAQGWINKLQQMVDDGFKSTEADALIKKIQKLLVEKDHAEDQINADTHNKAEAVKPTIRKKAKTYPTVPDTLSKKEIAEITRITKQEAEQNGVNYEKTLLFLCPFINISPARANIDEDFARRLMSKQQKLGKINIDGIFGDITSNMLLGKEILGNPKKEKAFIAISSMNSKFLLNIYDKVEKGEQLSNEDIKSVLKINNDAYTNGIENNMVTQLILVRAMAKKDAEGNPVNQKLVDSVAESQETKKAAHANTPEGIAQAEEYEDALGKDLFGVITDPNSTAKDIGKALIQSGLPIQLAVLGIFAYMAFGGTGSFTKGLAILGIGVAGGVIAGANGFTLDRIGEALFGDDEGPANPNISRLSPADIAKRDTVAKTIGNFKNERSNGLEELQSGQLKKFLANIQINRDKNPIAQKDAENIYHTLGDDVVFTASSISEIQGVIDDLGDTEKAAKILGSVPYKNLTIGGGKKLTSDQLKGILQALINSKDTTAGNIKSIYEGERGVIATVTDAAGNVLDGAGNLVDDAGSQFNKFTSYLGEQFGDGKTFDLSKVSDFFSSIDLSMFDGAISESGKVADKAIAGIVAFGVMGKEGVIDLYEKGVIAFENNILTIERPDIFDGSLAANKEAIEVRIKEITTLGGQQIAELKKMSKEFGADIQKRIDEVLNKGGSIEKVQKEIMSILKSVPDSSRGLVTNITDALEKAYDGMMSGLEEMWDEITSWKSDSSGVSGTTPLLILNQANGSSGVTQTSVLGDNHQIKAEKLREESNIRQQMNALSDTNLKSQLTEKKSSHTGLTTNLLLEFNDIYLKRKEQKPELKANDISSMDSIINSLGRIAGIEYANNNAGKNSKNTGSTKKAAESTENSTQQNTGRESKTNHLDIKEKIDVLVKKIENKTLQQNVQNSLNSGKEFHSKFLIDSNGKITMSGTIIAQTDIAIIQEIFSTITFSTQQQKDGVKSQYKQNEQFAIPNAIVPQTHDEIKKDALERVSNELENIKTKYLAIYIKEKVKGNTDSSKIIASLNEIKFGKDTSTNNNKWFLTSKPRNKYPIISEEDIDTLGVIIVLYNKIDTAGEPVGLMITGDKVENYQYTEDDSTGGSSEAPETATTHSGAQTPMVVPIIATPEKAAYKREGLVKQYDDIKDYAELQTQITELTIQVKKTLPDLINKKQKQIDDELNLDLDEQYESELNTLNAELSEAKKSLDVKLAEIKKLKPQLQPKYEKIAEQEIQLLINELEKIDNDGVKGIGMLEIIKNQKRLLAIKSLYGEISGLYGQKNTLNDWGNLSTRVSSVTSQLDTAIDGKKGGNALSIITGIAPSDPSGMADAKTLVKGLMQMSEERNFIDKIQDLLGLDSDASFIRNWYGESGANKVENLKHNINLGRVTLENTLLNYANKVNITDNNIDAYNTQIDNLSTYLEGLDGLGIIGDKSGNGEWKNVFEKRIDDFLNNKQNTASNNQSASSKSQSKSSSPTSGNSVGQNNPLSSIPSNLESTLERANQMGGFQSFETKFNALFKSDYISSGKSLKRFLNNLGQAELNLFTTEEQEIITFLKK